MEGLVVLKYVMWKPVFDSPSVSTAQALGLMATYHSHAGRKYSRNSAVCRIF